MHRQAPNSARFGHWHKKEGAQGKNLPRMIVFIVGGASFSEVRAVYEVTNERKNWECILGGSHLITPEQFLGDLKNLGEGQDEDWSSN